MSVDLNVYLFFPGTCKEAIEFYHSVFGGELHVQTVGDLPKEARGEMDGNENLVMHATLKGGGINLMASDSTRHEAYGRGPISLSLGGSNEEAMRELFDKLSEGGTEITPLKKEFWGATFGSFTDKFGIDWMMNIEQAA